LNSLSGGHPVSLLPGGKILSAKGVDVKKILLDSKIAVLSASSGSDARADKNNKVSDDENEDEDYDYEKELVVRPEYHDRTLNLCFTID
jgi:hypothetical protein